MKGTLARFAYLPDVTLGWLTFDRLRLATLEEGWRGDPDGPGGQRREGDLIESCIPDGPYQVHPHFSTNYPQGVWALSNPILGVYAPDTRPQGQKWGRDAILIHSGNHIDHIQGCILVGAKHVWSGKRWEIQAGTSRRAIEDLRDLLGTKQHHEIHIRPTVGTAERAA